MSGLLLTFFLGLFIVLGTIISLFIKNNKKFVTFSIGMAFGVMLMLVVFDLIPEAWEIFSGKFNNLVTLLLIILFSGVGIILLKVFDIFIPDHDNNLENENLLHIGVVSSIAFVLHNLIEGMAIYSVFQTQQSTAILLALGVGLHNVPLGIVIATMFNSYNKSSIKTLVISFFVSISTFVGGLIMFFLRGVFNEFVLGMLLAITLGMIIYIMFFELLHHIKKDPYKKVSLIGIIAGIVAILISLFF